MKSKSTEDAINSHQYQIERIKRAKIIFPDVELDCLDDGSRAFISASAITKCTFMHFMFIALNKTIAMRPYFEIKRKTKPNIKVYAQQSAVIPSFSYIVEILNTNASSMKIEDLPERCKKLFGEVLNEETAKISNAVNQIVQSSSTKELVES